MLNQSSMDMEVNEMLVSLLDVANPHAYYEDSDKDVPIVSGS